MIARLRNGSFVEYREFSLVSHRAGKGFGPENTLKSLAAAIEFGVEMVETDVRMSSDSVPIVHHGPFAGARLLGRMTMDEIRDREPEIPTLREFLSLAERRCAVNLEVKRCDAGVLAETIAGTDTLSPILISSFDVDFLKEYASIDGKAELGLLGQYELGAERILDNARRCRATTILPVSYYLSRELVGRSRARGIKVITWTLNATDQLRAAIEMGVDGAITDAYAELKSFLESTVFSGEEEGEHGRGALVT